MKQTKIIPLLLALTLLCGCGTNGTEETPAPAEPAATPSAETVTERYPNARVLTLESTENADGSFAHAAALDGAVLEEFDYVWHADPSAAHDVVKNCPAEYYTGAAPATEAAAYIAHDILYYPALDESGFKKVNYDGDTEWAYYYTAEEYGGYIFATLPVQGDAVPTQMMHSAAEAYENAVLHITEPGTYLLSGTWHGQILVDLGDPDETFTDENAKVTLVLCGAEVECTVAPALIFSDVYECDNGWETRETQSCAVETSQAGARVVLADGTVNSFTGANVYRMLKTVYKKEDDTSAVPVQKKAHKTDGAFYSYVSMNIGGEAEGSGVLNVTSTTYEGLDTELHLTINGGNVNVYSQDDGINVNEDGVSVFTMNGGSLHILAGLGSEGDGIDSNGYLVVNGGTLISAASPYSDSGMDSDCGTYVNGGTVLALGSTMDWAESDGSESGGQAALNLRFAQRQNADEAIIVTDTAGNVVFAYDPDRDEVAGNSARFYQGAILSAPGITVGSEYRIFVGGDVDGTETAGVYDPDTVTGFSDDAKLQGWSAAEDAGAFPGGPGRMEQPESRMQPGSGNSPERPDNAALPRDRDWEALQEAWDDPEPPRPGNGDMPPERPEEPAGMMPPDGFDAASAPAEALTTVFTLNRKVNFYSGVRDAEA